MSPSEAVPSAAVVSRFDVLLVGATNVGPSLAAERLLRARLGSDDVNGGWLPHLHFQLILEIGEARGDFPGVFRKSERERWRRVCPDPRPFLLIA